MFPGREAFNFDILQLTRLPHLGDCVEERVERLQLVLGQDAQQAGSQLPHFSFPFNWKEFPGHLHLRTAIHDHSCPLPLYKS